MPSYQISWFYEALQQATFGAGASLGWTETWFTTLTGGIDTVFSDPDVLLYTQYRSACLSEKYRMSFLRVTQQDALGLTKIQTLPPTVGNIKDPPGRSSQVQCAILVDFSALPVAPDTRVHHRRFLMRGLPASVIDGNVLNISSADWAQFLRFFNFVGVHSTGTPFDAIPAANTRRINLGIRFASTALPKFTINRIVQDPNDPKLINARAGLIAPANGTLVQISGVPGNLGRQLNKTWTMLGYDESPAPGPFMVLGKAREPLSLGTGYTGPGRAKMKRVEFAYKPADQYAVIGLRNKRTGGVFRRLRGRS